MSSQDKAGSPGGKGTKISPARDPNPSQSSPAAASSNTSTPRPSPTSNPTPGLDKGSENSDSSSALSLSNKEVVDISSSTSTGSDSGSDSDSDSDEHRSLFDPTVSDSDDNMKQQPNAKSPLIKKQRTKPPPSRVGMQYAYFGVTADNNEHWILTNFVSNEGPDLIKIVDADADDCRFIFQCYQIFLFISCACILTVSIITILHTAIEYIVPESLLIPVEERSYEFFHKQDIFALFIPTTIFYPGVVLVDSEATDSKTNCNIQFEPDEKESTAIDRTVEKKYVFTTAHILASMPNCGICSHTLKNRLNVPFAKCQKCDKAY